MERLHAVTRYESAPGLLYSSTLIRMVTRARFNTSESKQTSEEGGRKGGGVLSSSDDERFYVTRRIRV